MATPINKGISTNMMSGFASAQALKVKPLISRGAITGINTHVTTVASRM